jgi:hypothetical protein
MCSPLIRCLDLLAIRRLGNSLFDFFANFGIELLKRLMLSIFVE